MADSPILITGAAGFVGGHLLDLLEADGTPIVAWRRPGEPLPLPPTGTRSQWMDVDVLDASAVQAAVASLRPRIVYHLAGAAHAGQSWDHAAVTLRVNVLGTCNLLTALAVTGNAARVLIPGSALVYATQDRALRESDPLAPGSPYAVSKLAQEMCATTSVVGPGTPQAIVTRSFNHIGPRQDPSFFAAGFARQIARIEQGMDEPVLRVGNLDVRRDLTDVRDTVRAYAALIERGRAGEVYNVCTGVAQRVGDVLDGLLARARVPIDIVADPARFRPHDPAVVLGDRTCITADTGWEPAVALDRTLDDLLAFWRHAVRHMSRV
jgi:GDP-4-dehydro-6-deoxy-D-mannose reductase